MPCQRELIQTLHTTYSHMLHTEGHTNIIKTCENLVLNRSQNFEHHQGWNLRLPDCKVSAYPLCYSGDFTNCSMELEAADIKPLFTPSFQVPFHHMVYKNLKHPPKTWILLFTFINQQRSVCWLPSPILYNILGIYSTLFWELSQVTVILDFGWLKDQN